MCLRKFEVADMNKLNNMKKSTKVDFATYLGVIIAFIVITVLMNNGTLGRKQVGLLVPACCP